MPRDPQGAETHTIVRWRNVYKGAAHGLLRESREQADKNVNESPEFPRIAVERIETTTTITRYPIAPHAGEETQG